MRSMSDVRVEIVRTPRGKYKWRVVGGDGPPIRPARRGASGIKRSNAEWKADQLAMQAAMKVLYERQQAEAF